MSNFMANQGKQRPPGLSALLDLRGLDIPACRPGCERWGKQGGRAR